MSFICFNGKLHDAGTPVIPVSNRSYKWGDGIFETIRVKDGRIPLESYHFERLFLSLKLLQIDSAKLDQNSLVENIFQLCKANQCLESARVRLAVFREETSGASYSIEAIPLSIDELKWKEKGLHIDIYPFARKSMDAIANIKTSSFLIYILAGQYAHENKLDDVIVLNTAGRICDTSRANLFLIRNSELYTPALREGCISGVMRRHVIEQMKKTGYRIHQSEITQEDLLNADEVFLTNAITGIRWVEIFHDKKYLSQEVFSIFNRMEPTIIS